MENPAGEQWRDHLLSDSQLSNLLASLDTETAMQVLQRQVELRAKEDAAPKQNPVAEVIEGAIAPASPTFETDQTQVPPATPLEQPVSPSGSAVPSFSFPWDTGVNPTVTPPESQVPDVRIESPVLPAAQTPAVEVPSPPPVIDDEREAFIRSLEEIDAPKTPAKPKPSIWDETGSQPIAMPSHTIVPPVVAPVAQPAPIDQVPAQEVLPEEPEVKPVPAEARDESPAQSSAPAPSQPDSEQQSAEPQSAEQAVTEYEEEHKVPAQPNLVDQVILEVGGTDDDLPESATNEVNLPVVPTPEQKAGIADISSKDSQGHRPSISLLATWNGSGALLGLGLIGYLGGSSGLALSTLAVGAFVALVMTGVGFSVAALAARRGRASQQVLSRAAFGVIGNFGPATFMVLARLAATSVIGLVLALGLLDFTGLFTETVSIAVGASTITLSTAYPALTALLLLGFGVSLVRGQARFILSLIFAVLSVVSAGTITVLGYLADPAAFALIGAADGAQALGIASSIMVLLGLLWGSAAVDENVDLRRGTMGAKLLANGIFNWIFIGGLAILSGYTLTKLVLNPMLQIGVWVLLGVLMVALLSHLIARNAASLSGLGIRKVGVGSHLIVVFITLIVAVALLLRLGTEGLWYNLVGYLPVIGVPVIAWLGIFGADTLLRRVDYHEVSLLRAYGFYGRVNWFNLIGWLVATAAGWGLIRSSLIEFGWLGYLATPLNLGQPLLDAQLGVWVALFLGAIVPVIFSIPRIRNQERETQAIEARRSDLVEVFGDIQ